MKQTKHLLRTRIATLSLLGVAVIPALALWSCGSASVNAPQGSPSSSASLAGLKGSIGAKDFAEQYLLGQMTTQLLNSRGADTKYVKFPGLALAPIRAALKSDSILGYWEYTGTGWMDLLGKPAPVSGTQPQFDAVKALDAKSGIAWLDPAPLNDTYAFAMRSDDATKRSISSLSDLGRVTKQSRLTFCASKKFHDERWPGVAATYGFKSPRFIEIGGDDGYKALVSRQCDVAEVYSTDGRINSFGLKVLLDDKAHFPAYQAAFTLKESTLQAHPAIADVMRPLSALLTDDVMRTLNEKVQVERLDPAKVARDFLHSSGLIP